jgi:hypothetical protein
MLPDIRWQNNHDEEMIDEELNLPANNIDFFLDNYTFHKEVTWFA